MQALRLNKHHLPSIFNLACNYEQLNKLTQAKEQFLHAVHVDSRWASALYGLALVCIKLEQPEEACKHLQEALKQKPDDQSIKYLLALAYRNSKDVMNSWQMYKQIFPTEESIKGYQDRVEEYNRGIVESTSITGDDS